ncbi:high affinity choline transporter 1-like [Sardina pilchardus]|uniref:high affinity choline transporter 1-like n=1 Tax=Sardina pilchardus TaxID=27697 RepID=UPI002E11064D
MRILQAKRFKIMALNIPGLIAMIGFYAAVLATGIWASKKSKAKKTTGTVTEVALLGERSIDLSVGILTTTATWVGGGYILGMAEAVYTPNKGLIWAQMPLQYALSFIVGGLVFAKPMRERKYVTVIDPFQIRYGKTMTVLMVIPSLVGDVLWVACALTALGGMVSTIIDLQHAYSVMISAAVATIYTLLGGLYSVAYTDVIQLIFIFVGLWLCVPFMLLNPIPLDISVTAFNHTYQAPWLGQLKTRDISLWLDEWLTLGLGALSFQTVQQRNLSAVSPATAQIANFVAAVLCAIMSVPSILIGAVAASTDWNQTDYGSPSPYERKEAHVILPLCLENLAPSYVSIIGIGAITAAAMSSIDSCLLSCTSIFTSNLYKKIIRQQASDKELMWVIRITVVVAGVIGTALTFIDNSIVFFWFLSSDMAYCVILPQLVCVLFCDISNSYGAVVGLVLSLLLRVLSGEPLIGLPPVICFPGGEIIDDVYVQPHPVRTVVALFAFLCILLFSYIFAYLFRRGTLPKRWDVFGVTKVTISALDNQNTEPTSLSTADRESLMISLDAKS